MDQRAASRNLDEEPSAWSEQHRMQLADWVRSSVAGRGGESPSLPPCCAGRASLVSAELRQSGRLLWAGWMKATDPGRALPQLLSGAPTATREGANELLLCFGHDGQGVALAEEHPWRQLTANLQRGLAAYEFELTGQPATVQYVSPFMIVAQNRSVEKLCFQYAVEHGLTLAQSRAGRLTVRAYATQQFFIDLPHPRTPAVSLYRSNRLIPISAIDQLYLQRLLRQWGEYLVRSVRPNGRMTYLYYPSRGDEDLTRNNAIRQWMATCALSAWWRETQSDQVRAALQANLAYNLRTMYREAGRLGLILDGDKVKLGAVALAALALRAAPHADQFIGIQERLVATVDALWEATGQFRTFYRPAERRDCQNFYPGEALLLWATLIGENPASPLLDRFWRSFDFYQAWHLANRNPAFIPWHTQAYYHVWKATGDPRLPAAVFQMNDWLLDVQQWDAAPCPDCRGRFYDPQRPFGPPHASSTAVYLEGLAEALAIAQACGDTERSERYRTAIYRGLRSLAQLTFDEASDMFYVTRRTRLRGGIRTTEYNNVVRVDNVQHGFLALRRILDVL